ncbi:hypothetical protein ACT3TS_15050 [Specibacter sp. AOP5-B1-6]|uniref:hypothetical protein n=1 Tax=Specibacter sp. AOP5-B1-6 TaxID=3457653 RepID=UPI00402BA21B
MDTPHLILPSDLERVGQDRRTLVARRNKGELFRVRRGAYALSAEWKDLHPLRKYGLRAQALQLAARRQPVFSHATAALLWGLWTVGTPGRLHTMTEVTTGGRSENDVVRHRGSLTEGVVRCGPFLLTDKLTTVMQLILSLDFPYAVAVCDSSLRISDRKHAFNRFGPAGDEPLTREPVWQSNYPQGPPLLREDLVSAAEALHSKSARLRALTVIHFASALSGSAGESLSRAKMHMFGFPAPILQKKFVLRDGSNALVDFWFEELNLAGEFDGKDKYLRSGWGGGLSLQDRILKEKAREDDIRGQGVRFVRWTWAEMMNKNRFIHLLRQAGLRQK